MLRHNKLARLLAAMLVIVVLGGSLLSLAVSAEAGWLYRLLAGEAAELRIVAEPERICPGWNPHYTVTLVNMLDEPLTHLEVVAPAPEGLCLPRDGERSMVAGAYDPERDAMVWQVEALAPEAELVLQVVWHSYSHLPHGYAIEAVIEYRAEGYGGGEQAPRIIVDRADCEGVSGVYPTLTPTPSPTPSPTPATLLRFEPEQVALEQWQSQIISLTVEGAQDLYGLDIELAYDPLVIEIQDADLTREGVQVGAGVAPYPDFVVRNRVDADAGRIYYTVTQLGQRPPFEGEGLVLTLNVLAVGDGATSLAWITHDLATSDGGMISHRVGAAAQIAVQGQPDLPRPTMTPIPPPTVEPGQVALVYVAPEAASLAVGETVTVSVMVTDVAGLYGAEVFLRYDPALLAVLDADAELEGIQVMPGEAPLPHFMPVNRVDEAEGEIWYVATQLNPSEPFSGQGTMFSVQFVGLAPGGCTVELATRMLADRDGRSIGHHVRHGALQILP